MIDIEERCMLHWTIPCGPDLSGPQSRTTICPDPKNIYNALTYFRPEETRVVILGQDPYHSADGEGNLKASGLAFGYHRDYMGVPNSSLLNIARELEFCGWGLEDYSLESWAKQGVLLLNTELTTELGKPTAHRGLWKETVATVLDQIPIGIPFLAWGAWARELAVKYSSTHHIVATSHPCRYSATTGRQPFIGSSCFLQVNQILSATGLRPIRWGTPIGETIE